jgi:ribosome biogenesis protein Nip4
MKPFIEQFTEQPLIDEAHTRRIGNDFFLVSPDVAKTLQRIRLPALYAGAYLGRMTEKTATPGLDLLQILAKTDAKKVWLNEKGAWLFVCKRPALAQSILKTDAKPNELVLVMNEHDECIGYGLFDGKNVKHYYDIGDFLRREKRAKRIKNA